MLRGRPGQHRAAPVGDLGESERKRRRLAAYEVGCTKADKVMNTVFSSPIGGLASELPESVTRIGLKKLPGLAQHAAGLRRWCLV